MKVAVGADHAGFDLKGELVRWLKSEGHLVNDIGAHELDPNDDYPDFSVAVAKVIRSGDAERGIIICGSGVGASIAANKMPGIRAGLCQKSTCSVQQRRRSFADLQMVRPICKHEYTGRFTLHT